MQGYAWQGVAFLFAAMAGGCMGEARRPAAGDLVHSERRTEPQIYVADWANQRIVRMDDMRGAGWASCGGSGAEGQAFRFPVGIGVDQAGRIYVSEQHGRIIRMNDFSGRGWAMFSPPNAEDRLMNKFFGSWIFVDGRGRIYVTCEGEQKIARMDDITGANRIVFGREGRGTGEFQHPAGICVDEAGRIYIADSDNFRIVRIDDMAGANWVSLGSYGSGEREFINPCGICVDREGRIYIADQGNDRIVRMDGMSGGHWTEIGSFGIEPAKGRLYAPTAVCLDSRGRIYVSQCSSNHRIVRIDDMRGTNWTVFGSGGMGEGEFASPMGIFVR